MYTFPWHTGSVSRRGAVPAHTAREAQQEGVPLCAAARHGHPEEHQRRDGAEQQLYHPARISQLSGEGLRGRFPADGVPRKADFFTRQHGKWFSVF